MSDLYIYGPDETDFSTMGLVGALVPTECTFSETLNGESLLTFSHPIDKFGRHAAIQNGSIVLANVPVRTFPILNDRTAPTDGTAITVWTYTVRNVSKGTRKIFKQSTKTSAYNKYIQPGDSIVVTYIPSQQSGSTDNIRYRVLYNGITGWVYKDALSDEPTSTRSIPYGSESIQEIASPWEIREQYFRVYEVKKEIDIIQVSARHISYDLLYNMTSWQSENSVTVFDSIRGIMDNLYNPITQFKVYTNVNNTSVGIFTKRMNPINAFLDPENGICSKFKVDLMRDNYDLYFLDDPGTNRGIIVQYGKNMTGIDFTYSIDSVATRIVPIGEDKNGNDVLLQDSFTSEEISAMADQFSSSKQYEVGDLCIYTNKLYRCKNRHLGNWNAANFEEKKKDYVDSENVLNYPTIHIYELKCDNCKIGSGGISNISECRAEMKRQANALISGGCDQPKIEMSVEFINLGDTVQYKQFKNLENCFIGDYIIVRHPDLDIDVTAQIVKMEWDVLLERPQSVEVGTPGRTLANTGITTWQIPSGFSGSKIAEGTIDSKAIKEDVINTRHLQAETITAEKISTDSIAAKVGNYVKLYADTLTAGTFSTSDLHTALAKIDSLIANDISAQTITTDTLIAEIAKIVTLTCGTATFDAATVGHLVSNVFNLDGLGTMDDVYIHNLSVGYAQMIGATLGSLVLKASNDHYYKVDIDANGTLSTTDVTSSLTESEINAGMTSDGKRSIIETSLTLNDLSSYNIKGTVANINKIYAATIDTDTLLAREAFITKLYTSQIFGGKSLQMLTETDGNIRNWFTFNTNGLTISSPTLSGIATRMSSSSFDVVDTVHGNNFGSFTSRGLEVPSVVVNGMRIIGGMEADGGMAWVDE